LKRARAHVGNREKKEELSQLSQEEERDSIESFALATEVGSFEVLFAVAVEEGIEGEVSERGSGEGKEKTKGEGKGEAEIVAAEEPESKPESKDGEAEREGDESNVGAAEEVSCAPMSMLPERPFIPVAGPIPPVPVLIIFVPVASSGMTPQFPGPGMIGCEQTRMRSPA